MQTLKLQGTVTTKPSPGKTVGYEEVAVDWVVEFKITSEGEIKATCINIPTVTVYDYCEVTDQETPREITLYVKPNQVKLQGTIHGFNLMPQRFNYDQENESLTLEYF